MEPLISLQNVGIRYKRGNKFFRKAIYFDVLKSVNLNIYSGETLGIIGRNGAGKSSLLKIISGILKPDSGQIVNNGALVTLLALQVGFDPNLSGRDNAIFGGMLQGFSRKGIEKKIDEIREYAELGDFFFEPVRTYSNGMRARLGFSLSITINPDVLLVDEILSVGDQYFREKAEKTMVAKIQSDQTVVLVSHSVAQINRLCDRAIYISDGTIKAEGNPAEVVEVYRSQK